MATTETSDDERTGLRSLKNPPGTRDRADETRTDLTGLLRVIARREPSLPNLCRLPTGRNALQSSRSHHARRRRPETRRAKDQGTSSAQRTPSVGPQ
jgi:hypothetical protein